MQNTASRSRLTYRMQPVGSSSAYSSAYCLRWILAEPCRRSCTYEPTQKASGCSRTRASTPLATHSACTHVTAHRHVGPPLCTTGTRGKAPAAHLSPRHFLLREQSQEKPGSVPLTFKLRQGQASAPCGFAAPTEAPLAALRSPAEANKISWPCENSPPHLSTQRYTLKNNL